jgi:ADP-ribose pyrophosphatase
MSSIPSNATKVFDGIIFDVYHYEQELFDGSTATFEMLKRNDSVQCIPIVGDKILLIQDEQPNRLMQWALPGGQTDAGEDLEAAIARELQEETGYSCDTFELYKSYDISSKLDWRVHTFIARNTLNTHAIKNDAGERTTPVLVSFDECIDIVCREDFREKEFAIDILRMYKNNTLSEFKKLLFPN